ncbi:hypothetical protein DMH15_32550 [Streptomyces sp. WAC 06725]|uniref:hypothetical protein n=1 Tax=Streptomyces sp. WAC 06725 TaxID=2203209 RepID=UPI000F736C76|nr:hypothetical protein [Streptomyces sp. WAC 06725]RSO23002.1 hypothetical protein DMH15_32550 [Streptomyces sp. WAC 06725]
MRIGPVRVMHPVRAAADGYGALDDQRPEVPADDVLAVQLHSLHLGLDTYSTEPPASSTAATTRDEALALQAELRAARNGYAD